MQRKFDCPKKEFAYNNQCPTPSEGGKFGEN